MRSTYVRDERGSLGGMEGVVFGVLIFVMGTLMVVNAWNEVDARLATSAAAREAARTFVEAPDARTAEVSATQAARRAVAGHGRRAQIVEFAGASTSFARCQPVVATVSASVPRVALPVIGGTGGTRTVTARHSEVIDPYRSGIAGSATCN